MIDIVSIVVSVFIGIIVFATSFYLFVMYCHPDEKQIGTAIIYKLIVILCQGLAWGQILLIPLDVAISSGNLDNIRISVLYNIIYITIYIFIVFVTPFMIFLYDADEEDSKGKQIGFSFLFALGVAATWSIIIFVSYIWLSKYIDSKGFQQQISVGLYILISLEFIGWILLVTFGGIGIVFIPFDLILQFFQRPKQLTSDQAFEKKQQLQQRSVQIIQIGQQLRKSGEQFGNYDGGWFAKKFKQSDLEKQLQTFINSVNKLEEDNQIFQQELNITKTTIIGYYIMFLIGILSIFISILWFLQIFGSGLVNTGRSFQIFDPFLTQAASGGLNFLATIIYAIFALYLQACLVKGNVKAGFRIPLVISFHAMKLNKTYMNGFLFNSIIMMLGSLATTQIMVILYPSYLSNTYIGQFFQTEVFFQLPLFGELYGNNIFPTAFISIILLSCIVCAIFTILTFRKQKNKKK